MPIGSLRNSGLLAFAALCLALVGSPDTQAQTDEAIVIYTDTYRPFIEPEGEPDGDGMRMVRLILENMDQSFELRYRDFGFALYSTQRSPGVATFPWRKVPAREALFHFSEPLFETQTRLHFNRQAFPNGLAADQLTDLTLGQLEDYAYTGAIARLFDTADANRIEIRTYAREVEAIRALLVGEIDVLPLPSTVIEATTMPQFPNHIELLDSVAGISEPFPLHMIAAMTPEGEAFINAFDTSYARLREAGVLSGPITGSESVDTDFGETAELLASEGFPVIVGRLEQADGESAYYAIPQGTRALVLEWSDTILTASRSDRIFKTMVDETRVLILNGPHVGKELFVKNKHITVLE